MKRKSKTTTDAKASLPFSITGIQKPNEHTAGAELRTARQVIWDQERALLSKAKITGLPRKDWKPNDVAVLAAGPSLNDTWPRVMDLPWRSVFAINAACRMYLHHISCFGDFRAWDEIISPHIEMTTNCVFTTKGVYDMIAHRSAEGRTLCIPDRIGRLQWVRPQSFTIIAVLDLLMITRGIGHIWVFGCDQSGKDDCAPTPEENKTGRGAGRWRIERALLDDYHRRMGFSIITGIQQEIENGAG